MNAPTINLDPGLTADDYRKNFSLSLPPSLVLLPLGQLQEMIAESAESKFTNHFLAPTEAEHYQTFRYQKRKIEWLAGRIAAKQAAANLLSAAGDQNETYGPRHLVIIPDKNGRPNVKFTNKYGGRPCPDISISHSKDLAIAMAVQDGNCGIDLQQITSTVVRVQERFADDQEYEIIARHLELADDKKAAGLTLLWSAKEALRKGIGGHPLTGFLKMQFTDITEIKPGTMLLDFIIRKEQEFQARTVSFFYNDYGCSLTSICHKYKI